MFPLKERILIRGCYAHKLAGLGCAADYRANQSVLYAPFEGTITTYFGPQGGNWLRLVRPNGHKIEFAHLQSYYKTSGPVRVGEPLAITGNTGQVTTGPHKHIQIIDDKGRRLDPELYDWENMNTIDRPKLNQIYQEILFREPDPGAEGYLGQPEEIVRQALGSSQERKNLIALVEIARKIL